MQLEFITEHKISNLKTEDFFSFIIDRILDNRILIVEKELTAGETIALIARGLNEVVTETSHGINMTQITISSLTSGLIRSRKQEIKFHLFAPGSSQITKKDDGHYAIITEGDETTIALA